MAKKTLLEVAEYAVEVIEDLMDCVPPGFDQHYKEELAYLKQEVRESREYQMRSEIQDAEQLADFA